MVRGWKQFWRLDWEAVLAAGLESSSGGWTSVLGSWGEQSLPFPDSPESTTADTEPSVNWRGPEEAGPALPANPVPSSPPEARPSVPYPYQSNEMIGGDCVEAIKQRLLSKYENPSYEILQLTRIEAEDLFEVKAEIVKVMAGLDPTGDWMGRGARALDNPRTATGEPSLERLYAILESLNEEGIESQEFRNLKERVFLKRGNVGDETSVAGF